MRTGTHARLLFFSDGGQKGVGGFLGRGGRGGGRAPNEDTGALLPSVFASPPPPTEGARRWDEGEPSAGKSARRRGHPQGPAHRGARDGMPLTLHHGPGNRSRWRAGGQVPPRCDREPRANCRPAPGATAGRGRTCSAVSRPRRNHTERNSPGSRPAGGQPLMLLVLFLFLLLNPSVTCASFLP